MKLFSLALLSIAVLVLISKSAAASSSTPLVDLVDTRIGTGGFGFGIGSLNPGAQVPFGAYRVGPDTSAGLDELGIYSWMDFGGYQYPTTVDEIDCPILGPLLGPLLQPRFIAGFTHTHVVGAGGSDWMNFLVTATRGAGGDNSNSTNKSSSLLQPGGTNSKYNTSTEIAKPGYYSVHLETPDAVAEVTALRNGFSGLHRYTFAAGSLPAAVVLDLARAAPTALSQPTANSACREATLESVLQIDAHTIELSAAITMAGSMTGRSLSSDGGVKVFFFCEISVSSSSSARPAIASLQAWLDKQWMTPEQAVTNGATKSHSLGLVVTSNSSGAGVVFTVASAISFLSSAQARANLQGSSSGRGKKKRPDFDSAVSALQQLWERTLGTVSIPSDLVQEYSQPVAVFYSALYRVHLAPTDYTEPESQQYLGLDQTVYTSRFASVHRMGDLSIWDTYRCSTSLQMLLVPERVYDMVHSMMHMTQIEFPRPPYNSSEMRLPQWIMGSSVEADAMTGKHSASIMLGACAQNVTGMAGAARPGSAGLNCTDVYQTVSTAILAWCRRNMNCGQPGNCFYAANHIGTTLEGAVTAAAVLNAAERRGDAEMAAAIKPYAHMSLRQVWNDSAKLFCPRAAAEGEFDCPKGINWLPYPFESKYIESSAVENRWYAPGALSLLFDDLLGGRDAAANSLERFFQLSLMWETDVMHNTTLLQPWLAIGNEPSFLIPHLFAALGSKYAWRSQHWMRHVLEKRFFFGPAGLPGNDDYGAISSWLVFGYLGIYPLVPSNNYVVSSVPRFDRIGVRLPAGRGLQLDIVCYNRTTTSAATNASNYIKSVKINGVALASPTFSFDDLLVSRSNRASSSVATIEFFLTPTPVVFGGGDDAIWLPSEESTTISDSEKQEMKHVAKKLANFMAQEQQSKMTEQKRGGSGRKWLKDLMK